MPWEKSFNVDEAINNAMILFWEKGYTDSSMANLLDVTGLTKGSFYNAFGSKRDLFVKTLLKYDADARRDLLQELVAMDAPQTAIETFFDRVIQDTVETTGKKGCFIVNTSLELYNHNQETQKIVTNAFSSIETFFKQMIELGQIRKEIAESINPKEMAKLLLSTLVGIRVLGRGVYDRAALQSISDQILANFR